MEKTTILVAGAGHGGLAAAALLARAGHDVTVFEAQSEDAIGYDWCDCVRLSCFDRTGLRRPPQDALTPMQAISYFNPRKSVCIRTKASDPAVSFVIDRKLLAHHLIDLARESGAKLCFSHRVLRALTDGTRVTGLVTESGEHRADLVIDAAGIDSPVRASLPDACGVEREIKSQDTLYTYRALYADNGKPSDLPAYCAYFYHCGNRGFDWVIREPEYVDILVASFGRIDEAVVENAVRDFRADHPYIGDELLRGGSCSRIPLRRTLPQFVCDGYAAIGDSASMIEPLSGSGLTVSIRSAGFLAETVGAARDYSVASLWPYEAAYFKEFLSMILRQDSLKDVMLYMNERCIDALFEKKIVTEKEFKSGKQTASDILHKAVGTITTPAVIPHFVKLMRRGKRQQHLKETLPTVYDPEQIARWKAAYMQF